MMTHRTLILTRLILSILFLPLATLRAQDVKEPPLLIAHRGLLHHAPENTLPAFAACLDLRLGMEIDVHRSKDGHLVCIHDDDVKRTTNGTGLVHDLTLAELRKLDAGSWFDPLFSGATIPTLEEIFQRVQKKNHKSILLALDLKIDDPTVERDIADLVRKYDLVPQVICIGRTISEPDVRKKFKAAEPKLPVAVLAQTADDLPQVLADPLGDWMYVRFVPTAEQVAKVHQQGKRVFLVGTTVSGLEPANWECVKEAGVDALLTDYPLECRVTWRKEKQ